ncbi:protein TILLER ANGLE CONTROL 1 [Lycium barbarum]|uniref:protein TILLER ANGLE CONTROL 1 n=1 Tax=Lycium barbarum TaxID=112863 RepID=UPI00293E16AE|nr:protein TILLER ANGLE CONTROL 1 [Lycium barbarum]XP_060218347.1 protein TILLER ANGLE CONTROL 1 [Lycium barbarum]
MKIFSWVQRKLNQKDGLFDRNVKKDEVKINNANIGDTQLLLQDASMAHLLDSWKGGILTIGTLGFDQLIKDQSCDLDDDFIDEECEITINDHEEDQEELNPLMYANGHEQSHEAPKANVIMGIDGNTLARRLTDDDDESNNGSKKERITLADLFSADFSDKKKVHLPDLNVTNKKTSKPQVKLGVSFAKKFIPRVREDSRPILKLQQLMTRALKRKVHPDMESKNHKNSRVIGAAAANMLELSHVTSESISLLEIQETTA